MTPYALFDTAIGRCGLAWGPDGLLTLQLPEATEALTRQRLTLHLDDPQETAPPQHIRQTIDAVIALTEGRNMDLTQVPLDMAHVSAYNRRLYEAIRAIPPGATRTYGQIAEDLGEPGAARAVGRAMGQNPWPIIVPCHRVVAAGGKTGGFSAHGGVDTKLRLLAIEQAHRSTEGALF
ncbi:MAG: methylated-DNA-[protein]-cysteine S-methyltransferase [Frankiales bacterium]|jgi:methylated-DNA-[protein]-cysteine S-methyltransferase|nr:methylated-DNA-[protein]-cysteine S-methyltransferase [Frankiales bacterium]